MTKGYKVDAVKSRGTLLSQDQGLAERLMARQQELVGSDRLLLIQHDHQHVMAVMFQT